MTLGQSLLGEKFVWVGGGGGGLKVSLVLALVQNQIWTWTKLNKICMLKNYLKSPLYFLYISTDEAWCKLTQNSIYMTRQIAHNLKCPSCDKTVVAQCELRDHTQILHDQVGPVFK
jgi:hypothetical protein